MCVQTVETRPFLLGLSAKVNVCIGLLLSNIPFSPPPSLSEDMYAQDSIDMLTGAGIQFKRHEEEGIELDQFAELLMSSGLVLSEDITWITFAR